MAARYRLGCTSIQTNGVVDDAAKYCKYGSLGTHETTRHSFNMKCFGYMYVIIYVCILLLYIYICINTDIYIYIMFVHTQLHTFIVCICVYIYIYGRYFQLRYLKWSLIWIPLGLVQIHRFPCSVLEASGRHLGNGARETRDSLKDAELVHWRDERQI